MGTLKIAFFSSLVLEEGATISTAIIAVEIGLRLITGQLAFQPALFVLLLTPEFFQPLRQLGAKYHAGMTGTNAAQRIITLLETVPATQQSTQQPAANLFAQPPTICFAQVTYAYEEQQRPALGDISLQINSGQKVALIGPSGAGKSTLTHLLLRFINPDSGTISCNGTPLAEMSPASWRSQIAWVPQHPYLFDESIAANIRLGNTSATFAQVVTAAQQANIHEFILSLPQGYATRIGERGTRLSGGEAQRISLARAFLKNAPLLILDEATSYIDIENETAILEALARLKQGRTVIMIAHHLSTIYDADQIIVLDKGRIVETGTHQMLSQRSGVYHELLAAHKGKEA
jgi:ATP-binding cassette subfamily C protein CydD